MYDPLNRDPEKLYEAALATVREFKKASPSLLQRKLNLGYGTASALIERMEKEGIVGPLGSLNSASRAVLR